MAQIIYSENALANLERAFDFIAAHDPVAAIAAAAAIRDLFVFVIRAATGSRRNEGHC